MSRTRSSVAGRIDVTSLLLQDRRVIVRTYLPADYEWTDHDYPVIYMFDGHNLFDRTTSTYDKEWRIDETMEAFAAQGRYRPAIVVGIDAPQTRFERYAMYSVGDWEYRKTPDSRLIRRIEGYGDVTAQFLMKRVKPYIQRTYRAARDRERVGVAGSSMGGYMSLYTAARYPALVSKVIAFSPVLMDHPMRGWEVRDVIVRAGASAPQRFYLETGDRETVEFAGARQLADHLEEVRLTLREAGHKDVLARLVPRGRHDERHWAKQFPAAYLWTFYGIQPADY